MLTAMKIILVYKKEFKFEDKYILRTLDKFIAEKIGISARSWAIFVNKISNVCFKVSQHIWFVDNLVIRLSDLAILCRLGLKLKITYTNIVD